MKRQILQEIEQIEIKVKVKPLGEIFKHEIARWEGEQFRRTGRVVRWDASRSSVENLRLCLNYIRHNLTNYDVLRKRYGYGDDAAYQLIRRKAFAAIKAAYPQLAPVIRIDMASAGI